MLLFNITLIYFHGIIQSPTSSILLDLNSCNSDQNLKKILYNEKEIRIYESKRYPYNLIGLAKLIIIPGSTSHTEINDLDENTKGGYKVRFTHLFQFRNYYNTRLSIFIGLDLGSSLIYNSV